MIQIGWSRTLAQALERGQPAVMITQIGERGSSPRAQGAKMVVTPSAQYDTLGGGNLEFQAVNYARELLNKGEDGVFELCYTLSGTLGQCCGGEVRVLFEVFNSALPELFLFGAGHIAQALVPILDELPMRLNWIDDREELFVRPVPETVNRIERAPLDVAESLPTNAWVLVMTHDHQLDFDLVKTVLNRDDFTYLGMIGSNTKALKFRQRLAQRGLSTAQIERLNSPVGIKDFKIKRPMEIAVSVAVDLIKRYQQE